MSLRWNQIGLTFLIGLLMGTVLGAVRARSMFRRPTDPAVRQERMLKKFSSRLDLSADQRQTVGQILNTKRTKIDAIFVQMRPQFEAVRQETSDEIKKVLNPDQQKKYEALDAEMEQRFKERFPNR